MIFKQLRVRGCYKIQMEPEADERGWFARTFCVEEFKRHGLSFRVAQSSVSQNNVKATLRGMHFQRSPSRECKIVRCGKGAIYDVVLDLRKHSQSYLQWVSAELTENDGEMVYVPEGCAHGYLTLTDDTQIVYQMNERYSPELSDGVRWDDPAFSIDWPEIGPLTISDRDRSFPDYRG